MVASVLLLLATGIGNPFYPLRRLGMVFLQGEGEAPVLRRVERLALRNVCASRRNYNIDGDEALLITRSAESDLAAFESHRALLIAHAYRMLGDLARAEDIVQDAWLKWAGPHEAVISARAYLVTLVTRLCLN